MFTKCIFESRKIILKNSIFTFTTQNLTIPIIQLDKYLNKSEGWKQECKLASECLHEAGIIILRDSVKYNFNTLES
jgi:hypothetical protein